MPSRNSQPSIEKAKASGASQEKIEKKIQETQHVREIYKNPTINVAMTFMEVFPIGLGATLLSAAILRKSTAYASAVEVS